MSRSRAEILAGDQDDPLARFEPTPDRPWDSASAAHLLRRAGFQPSRGEIATAASAGLEATVDSLIKGATSDEGESPRARELDELADRIARGNDLSVLRGWWLQRMTRTRRPLHARLSVFWHGHFATSNVKVESATLMARQLATIERLGAGRFEPLLMAMSKDPAMIYWLDGNSNIKGRPNENYARELFELFALGVGNYTERDIKEAARAFTGWHTRDGEFRYHTRDHDGSNKTVFGTTGALTGEDVIALTVRHDACAGFLALKLLREFLCPEPPRDLLESFAARLRETDLDIAQALRTLFQSRAMFDPRWYRARIKSPVEFVVGAVRSLEARAPADTLADAANQMGQRLLEPPSVKGWNGHREWINSSTMLVRLNGVERLASDGTLLNTSRLRDTHALSDRSSIVEFCSQVTLDGRVPAELAAELQKIEGEPDDVMRRSLRVLMSAPEYQLA